MQASLFELVCCKHACLAQAPRRSGLRLICSWSHFHHSGAPPPEAYAATHHLNWEAQFLDTRWTLGGHTMDTRWTQRWTHDGHCGNTTFWARPETNNGRTKQVPKVAHVSWCFCSVHRVSIVVSIVRPPRVHRCVRRYHVNRGYVRRTLCKPSGKHM